MNRFLAGMIKVISQFFASVQPAGQGSCKGMDHTKQKNLAASAAKPYFRIQTTRDMMRSIMSSLLYKQQPTKLIAKAALLTAVPATTLHLTAKRPIMRTLFNKHRMLTIAFVMVNLFFVSAVFAKTTTWTPTVGGAWTTAGNWNNGTPVAGDDVIINSDQSAAITAVPSISLNSLTINGNCILSGSGNPSLITITGTFSVASSKMLTLGVNVNANRVNLTLASGGTGIIDGTVRLNTNSTNEIFTNAGDLTISANGFIDDISNNADFTLSATGILNIKSTAGISTTAATGNIRVTGARTYTAGSVVFYNGSAAQVLGNAMPGTCNITIDNTSGVTLSANSTTTGLLTMANGTLNMNTFTLTVGSLTGSSNITATSGSRLLTVGSDNSSPAAYSGVISNGGGTVSLTKTGTGTLTLSGTNTYTGTTTISAGMILLNSAGALPGGIGSTGGTSNLSLNGGVLGLGAGDFTRGIGTGATQVQFNTASSGFAAYGADRIVNFGGASAAVTWAGGDFVENGDALILSAADATHTITVQNPISTNGAVRTIQVDNGSAATDAVISGVISSTGGITKTGTGLLSLTATNTNTGVTTISAGVLSVATIGNGGVAGNLSQASNAAGNLVLNGGTLQYTGATASTDRNYTLPNGTTSSIDITTAGTNLTISGASTGTSGALTKIGSGTLTLAGANAYTGTTTISAGTLKLGSASERISNSSALVNNATFDLGGFSETIASLAGTGTVTSSAAGSVTFTVNGTSSSSFSGIIENGSGTVGLSKAGTSTLTLSGINTYSGATSITGGTITISAANVLPDNSAVSLGGGTLSTGSGAGFNETIGTLALSTTGTLDVGTGVHTLTISNSSSVAWPGTVLTITGWTGAGFPLTATGGKIMVGVGGLLPAQLAKITFSGFSAGAQITGAGELVPKNTTFYSKSSSAAQTATNWNTQRDGLGTNAAAADFTNGSIFVVQGTGNGAHTMTASGAWSVSGVGSRVIIEGGGTLTANSAITLSTTTTFQIDNNGLYIHNNTSAPSTTIFNGTEEFAASSNVRIDNWQSTSTILTTGVTLPFGNLELNWAAGATWSQSLTGTVNLTVGNFTITTLGGAAVEFRFTSPTTGTALTLGIGGNLTVTAGVLALVGGGSNGSRACTVNVGGNVSIAGTIDLSSNNTTSGAIALNIGGDFAVSGTGLLKSTTGSGTRTVNFNKASGSQTFTSTAAGVNTNAITFNVGNATSTNTLQLLSNFIMNNTGSLNVLNNATLNCGTNTVQATTANTQGNFNLNSGGTLMIGSAAGITSSGASGNIQTATSRVFNSAANYVYNGTGGLQTTGTGLPATVAGLTINNTAGVTLTNDVSISNSLLLSNGIFDAALNSKTVTVTNTATSAVSGGSITNFIRGPLRWSLAVGDYVFPVGRSTGNYFPFGLNLSAAASPVVTAEAFDTDAGAGATFDNTISSISHTEYWGATLNSGTFTGKVSLTRVNALTTEDRIAKSTLQGGTYTSIGGTAASPSINNSNDISSFSFFVMASSANCPASTAVAPSADQEVCEGTGANELTATITNTSGAGTPTLQYQWYYNTANSNTVAGATLIAGATLPNYTPLSGVAESGTTRYYFCVGYATDNNCGQTNATQSLASNAVKVTVNGLTGTPVFTAGATTLCQNAPDETYTATASNSTGIVYSVLPIVAGTINPSTGVMDWDGGFSGTATITATATGPCGVTTADRVVTVNVTPATPTITPGGTTAICPGGSVILTSSSASGNQWYKDNVLLGGETNQTYTADANGAYTVIVTSLGCSSLPSDATVVTTNTVTSISVQPVGGAICPGGNIVLSVTASGTNLHYQWKQDGNNVGADQNSFTATEAGSYTVVVTGDCGTATSDAAVVTMNTATTIDVQPVGGAICPGGNILLSVTASGTNLHYQWKYGVTNVGLDQNTFAATIAGTYTVEVTGDCGTVTSDAAVVTVNAATTIDVQPVGGAICPGGNIVLSVTASGTGTLHYQWKQDGNNVGADQNTYTASAAGTYTVVVTGDCGTVTSNDAVVTMNTTTAINVQPVGGAICPGGNILLSVTAAGTNLHYQWKQDGNNVGTDQNTYSATAAGSYTVEVTGDCGTVISDAAVVTVNAATTIDVQPIGGAICPGGNILLSVTASGTGTLHYQWKNGVTNVGTDQNTFSATVAGSYTVEVTGDCGTVISDAAVVTVNAATTIDVQPVGGAICPGGNIVLSVTASGTGTLHYQWKQDGNDVGADQNTYTASAAGTYTVVVTGDCGTVTSNDAVVTMNTTTVIDVQPVGGAICPGGNILLSVTASGTNLHYQWKNGVTNVGADQNTYSATAAGSYTVVVTGDCGTVTSDAAVVTVNAATTIDVQPVGGAICPGGNILLSVTASGTGTLHYQWKQDGNNVGADQNTYSATAGGSYTVEVTGDCGTVTSEAAVVIMNTTTAINVQPAGGAICPGGNILLSVTAAGTNLHYQWKQDGNNVGTDQNTYSATAAGSYTVEVTGDCGTVISDAAVVTVNAATTIDVQPIGGAICPGGNILLSVTASGTGTLHYQWKNGVTNVGADQNTYSATAGGSYTVEVTGDCGTVISDAAVVTVNAATTIDVQPVGGAICPGGNIVLSVTASGTGTLHYQWKQDGNDVGADQNTYTASAAGTYTVVVTGDCGTVTSNDAVVTMNTTTVIDVQPVGGAICPGGNILLSVTASGTNLHYQWKQDGNNVGADQNTYSATAAGTYTVEVTGDCGTVTSDDAIVIMNPVTGVPTFTAGATTICQNAADETYTATAANSTGITYSVTPLIAGVINPSTGVMNWDGGFSGTAIITATATGICGSTSADRIVTVNPPPPAPVVTAGGATTFCQGGSVILTSSSATGNQWYKDNVLLSGETNQTYTATTSGSYTAVVTALGCLSIPSDLTIVTVNPTPATPTISASGPTTFCNGGSVILTSSSATGNQWYKDNVLLSGETNQIYTATTSGSYTVIVTALGCPSLVSAATAVTVNAVTVIDVQPVGGAICPGGSILLSVTATGTNLHYQWKLGVDDVGSDQNSYLATAAGTYSVIVIGDCGTEISADAVVTVNTVTAIDVQPVGGAICPGGNILLSVTASGTNLHYQWKKDGNNVGSDQNNYSATSTGTYTVVVTGDCGTVTSDDAVVTITTYTITATAGANGTITPGTGLVNCGSNNTYTIAANACYHIADVLVNGVSVGAVSTYTFNNVTGDSTISASFAIDTYTITASAGANGSIAPSGVATVNCGSNTTYTITADPCYHVADVLVNGVSVGAVSTYTFNNVTGDSTISATFAINTYTVTSGAGAGGSITPNGATTVNCGGSQSYTITADPCYHIADVLVNGVSVGAVSTYTFNNVTGDSTISASFAINTYTITATAGANGSVTPAGVTTVNCGSNNTYTITADPCYHIADVLVNGVSVGAVSNYTFNNVTGDSTISASFAIDTYTITATSGANGSVTPAGVTTLNCGGSQSYTITADPCYHIADVLVNGVSVGAVSTYTFNNVTGDSTISASFAINTYTVTSSAGAGGSITPNGATTVNCGGSQSYTITANACYHIADVLVNGISVGAVSTYTFNNVTGDSTISASFAIDTYTITVTAGSNGTITPGTGLVNCGSNNTYTITADPCYHIADVLVNGVSVGAVSSYTFNNVTGDSTISASFAINTYTITATSGANGSVTPAGVTTVNCGGSQSYTITADPCYHIADVLVNGVSVGAVSTYTFNNVTGDSTISANFAINTYTITVTAGANGTITPGTGLVNCGGSQSYTITANACYHIADVLVNGVSVGAVSTYTFNNVTGDSTISASFAIDTYTITATAGTNGSIAPSGVTTVNCGTNTTYTITADPCYHIADVLVNGVSVGTVSTYTFNNVTGDSTISASFAIDTHTITATAGANGSVTPSGVTTVNCGGSQSYSITADPCYHIADVLVNGVSVGAVSTYTFNNVTGDSTISASFAIDTYTITVTSGANGTITPGTGTVNCGSNNTYTITADPCYHIADVLVNGISVGAVSTYTFNNVTGDSTISASFAIDTYTITASAGANGSIAPSGVATVNCGTNNTYTITADPCYHVADVLVNGVSVGAVSTYTFNNVTGDSTISATFALNTYTITATSGANGSVTPSGVTTVNCGGSQSYTITANACYHIADVLVNGVSVGAVSTYTFINVTGDSTISASFAINTYTITATSGANGSVTPSGVTTVNCGGSQSYTITANACYHIADVLVNGVSVGAVSTYTFNNVTGDSTISASFAIDTYTITASAGANGSVTPAGVTTLNCGASQSYTITADPCYHIADVLVNGVSVGAVSTYTFNNVTGDSTISASFAINAYTITVTAGANGTITPGTGTVNCGGSQSYTITANACYHIADVLVNGVSVGAVSTYTFNNVTGDSTISASFAIDTYTITVTAGSNGTITPGTGLVNCGSNNTYTITADPCYHIADVLVNGVSVGAVSTYTFNNVTGDSTISASFAINTYTITATSGANGSVTPAGVTTLNCGGSQSYTITADPCYHIADVLVNGVSVGAVSTYTFNNVTGDSTISASFAINTYTITATSGANGSVTPSGVTTVNCGGSQSYTITANACYHIADVLVNGVSVGAVSTYTFNNVTGDSTISATFAIDTYTITVTAGSNGTITPGTGLVNCGSNSTYTIAADPCYHIADVLVNGVSVGVVSTYTFNNVAGDSTISASFAIDTYTITASAGANGSIAPSGVATVNCGGSQSYSITADPCYHIADVLVNGVSVGAVSTYTFNNVTGDSTISASFAINTYTITATSGANGSVTPSGVTTVNCGGSQSYTITANACYHIADVLVNGVSVGAVSTYTFNDVTGDSTISATFAIDTYTITATSGANGSVTPAGATTVNCGGSQSYTITADPCYHIADVLVNGVSVGAVSTYTFNNVTGDSTISASFAIDTYTITASAGANGSIAPSGVTTVNCGGSQSYSITADPCYHIADVLVNGVSVGAVSSYTFNNVTGDSTISASFAINTYTITATSGSNGSIAPSGVTTVNCGGSQSYTITADPCYHIADVLVNGVSVGAVSTYTFNNVTGDSTISASFAIDTYTITASAGANGSVTPAGISTVNCGTNKSYTITPDAGYVIGSVLVDGVSVGTPASYTFTNVTANHTISATFKLQITADPAIVEVYMTDMSDVLINANQIPFNSVNKVKVPVQNLSFSNIIPAGTTKIRIDLGSKLQLNTGFDLGTAPLSAYFNWTKVVEAGNDVIYGDQIADLPAFFGGDGNAIAIFDVKAVTAGTSIVNADFQVTNHNNANQFLVDANTLNNHGDINYTVLNAFVINSVTSTNVTCNGINNGSITVTVTGGASPYDFSKDNGATWVLAQAGTYTFTGVAAGNYDIKVRDAASQEVTYTGNPVVITQPAAINLVSISQTTINCNGQTATVTITATGGTAPLSYTFDGVTNGTGVFTGITAGTYNYSITDANSCGPVAGTFTVIQPAAINVSNVSQTTVACHGGSATATITASGGTAPLSYTFNGVTNGTGVFPVILAGTYNYSVTDANSCTPVTGTFTVVQPEVISVTNVSQSAIACNGGTANVTITAAGGTAPYLYTFNGVTHLSNVFTGIPAGVNYPYSVTDANGCTAATGTFTVVEPAVITVSNVTQSTIACHGGTGTVTITAAGGTAPLSYTFNGVTQVNNNVFTGIPAGVNYAYSVTDVNGCTAATGTFTVDEPTAISVSNISQTAIACNGGTATVTITAAGGTGALSYTFNSVTNGTGIFPGVTGGTYSYSVTDANGCTPVTGNFTVVQPTLLTITKTTHVNPSTGCDLTGSISVSAGGGTPNYQFKIDAGGWLTPTPVNGTTYTFTNLGAGLHTMYVQDANGCQQQTTFTLTGPANTDLSLGSDNNDNIFPASGTQRDIVYNVGEVGGKPGTPVKLRIFKVSGYNIVFNPSETSVTIGFNTYPVENGNWTMTNSGGFVEFTRNAPLTCYDLQYISIKLQRVTTNKTRFNLNAVILPATSEILFNNNSNSLLFIGN